VEVPTNLALTSIEFNVAPSVTIAGGNIIKIKVPQGFTVGTVKSKAFFFFHNKIFHSVIL